MLHGVMFRPPANVRWEPGAWAVRALNRKNLVFSSDLQNSERAKEVTWGAFPQGAYFGELL